MTAVRQFILQPLSPKVFVVFRFVQSAGGNKSIKAGIVEAE